MAEASKFYITSDYRQSTEGLDELALSIKNDGLYQPMVVKPDEEGKYEIVAGRRRFRAMTEYLHWNHLDEYDHFVVREGVDGLIAQFQENFNRQDFKPSELAGLVKSIHERQVEKHGHSVRGMGGGWGLKDTGQMIGRDSAFVSRMLTIAEKKDEVEDCTSVQEALQKVDQSKTKQMQEKLRESRYKEEQEAAADTNLEDMIFHTEPVKAEDYLGELSNESVDLVLTDPPYAINYDTMVEAKSYASYQDDPKTVKSILQSCIPEYYRVLRDDRYCIIFTAFEWLEFVRNEMKSAGFKVASTPIVWVKMNSSGKSMNPSKTLASQSEIAVYGWKGDAQLARSGQGNTFPYPIVRENRIHVAQKPDGLLEHIVKIFCQEGQTVLDTFAGSLSTLRACYTSGRNFIGCEEIEDFLQDAVNYTRDWAKEEKENA